MPGPPQEDTRSLAGRLYDAHGAALYRYALMVLADGRDAEDVVHQVFTNLLRLRRIPETPGAYLRRAVRNECYSRLRRRLRRVEADERLLEAVVVEHTALDDRLALERGLRELPAEQREVVHLHVYEGWTFREVGDLTGVSINTVTARYRYALAALRRVLALPRSERT